MLLLLQEAYGGFNSSRVVDDYVYYADVVFKHLGRYVGAGDWISFNEPLVTCDLGFKAGEGLELGRQCALRALLERCLHCMQTHGC